ncbi:glycosyltransferase [Alkalihalobacterium sp. APHAB7]|uniref:glycosyltransferase n=1 Tax=Alkalihalobacterium sp. APHAB7 TaxID=3402081 RepID=UPI003AAB47F4
MKNTIKKWVFKSFNNITDIKFNIKDLDTELFRDTFDNAVIRKKQYWEREKEKRPSLGAIIRVKNGADYLYLSLCSIADLCNEIVVIDNGSTDETIEIVEKFSSNIKALNKNLKISVYDYPIKTCRAGEGYSNCVQKNPEGSLARFYTYAFSLSECDYLMKFDAHYMLIPKFISVINQKLKRKPERIRLNIRDIYGRHHGFEPLIFKNNEFWYEDIEYFETIKFKKDIPLRHFFDNTILSPSVIHVKRLGYLEGKK